MAGSTTVERDARRGWAVSNQEIDEELSMPGAHELLTTTAYAHLAYAGTDGAPRVVPVGFFWTGDEVVISTASSAPKVAALSARPDVAVTIDTDTVSPAVVEAVLWGAAAPWAPQCPRT